MKTETGHMTEAEAGIETINEDLVGTKEIADLGTMVDPCLGIKMKRRGVITAENQVIL